MKLTRGFTYLPRVVCAVIENKQSTFGRISITKYKGERTCDACTGYKGNGEPKRCTNTAKYAVLRHVTGMSEYYCKIHAKDSWQDIGHNA